MQLWANFFEYPENKNFPEKSGCYFLTIIAKALIPLSQLTAYLNHNNKPIFKKVGNIKS